MAKPSTDEVYSRQNVKMKMMLNNRDMHVRILEINRKSIIVLLKVVKPV